MAVARFYDHNQGEWVLLAAGRDGTSGASSWDDLADKPATFPPGPHSHTVAQISDLPEIRSSAVADSLVQRSPTGNVLVADTPSGPSSATSKSYVDTEMGKKADASRVTALEDSQPIIVSEMDPNPLPGRIYFVTGA